MTRLGDMAAYVRSKNAGPFWVTIDIFCGDSDRFNRLRRAPGLERTAIARLYRSRVQEILRFDMADLNVIKISFPRSCAQGACRDADMHAGQLFVPLLGVEVDSNMGTPALDVAELER